MDILYSKNGTPLILSSNSFFAATNGSPTGISPEQKKALSQTVDTKTDQDFTDVSGSCDLLSKLYFSAERNS